MSIALNGDGIISGVSTLTTPLTGVTTVTNLVTTDIAVGTGASVFSPAANTLAFGTNNSERVRVDSSGNVGVGTENPGLPLDVVSDSSSETVRFRGGPTNVGTLRFTSNDAASNYSYVQSRSTAFYVGTGATIPLIFETDSGERARILAAGGLTFNGDTAAANALDDYEEGTWTPVYFLGGVQQSYNTEIIAYYTKIGRMVYVNFWTGWGAYGRDNFPSGSGSRFEIGGLPYSINNTYQPGAIGQARTQGGLSANFSISSDSADRICFYGTGGSFGGWVGNASLAASSISSITSPVIAGAFWYIN